MSGNSPAKALPRSFLFPAIPWAKAHEEIIGRDQHNAGQIKRVRDIYLDGTKGEALFF